MLKTRKAEQKVKIDIYDEIKAKIKTGSELRFVLVL